MWYCSECGKKNNGKFCTRCGTKYVEIEEDPQVTAAEGLSPGSPGGTDGDGADRLGRTEAPSAEAEVCNAAALCRRSAEGSAPFSGSKAPSAEASGYSEAASAAEEMPLESVKSVPEADAPSGREERIPEPPIANDVPEKAAKTKNRWVAPFLRKEEAPVEKETVGASFIRRDFTEPAEKEEPMMKSPIADDVPEEAAETENRRVASDTRKEEAPAEEETVGASFIRRDFTEPAEKEEPMMKSPIADDVPEEAAETENRWVAPYLRKGETPVEEETVGPRFIRRDPSGAPMTEDETEGEVLSAEGVFTHRLPPREEEDREWRYSKRVLFSVGAVGGVVLLALLILVGSLFVFHRSDDEPLPVSSGVYAYVSGVKDTTPLYADKSIKSDVLAELKNGDAVEYLEAINSEFAYVLDPATEQYGYVRRVYLVNDENDVDYGNVENKYDDEKSLGYFYVTKVKDYLTLWENPDGGGVVKAKMECGYKVSLLEKTNDSYWYVFDYTSAERGYVRCSYLTDSKSKVVYPFKEPKDKTIIGEFYVTGVKNYLPIYSRPNTGGDVRGKLNNGDKVGLIEKTNGSYWYIGANGVYGWVSASYLTATPPTPEPAPTPTPEPTPAPPPDTSKDYKVTGTQEYLPILNAASADAAEVARLHNGDTVKVIDSSGDTFWYIEVPSTGVKGYVVKDYLTK